MEITYNQVEELIEQLAAMTVAASITPETVANIFGKMLGLTEQEQARVMQMAQTYIENKIQEGIPADNIILQSGATAEEEIQNLAESSASTASNNGKTNTNSGSIEEKVNALIDIVVQMIQYIVFHGGTPFNIPQQLTTNLQLLRLTNADVSTTALCGQAVCGQALCGTY